MEIKAPVPPFTPDAARQRVRMAEDAWNSRDPDRVVLVYTEDTRWRNDYRLIKELWACDGDRIASSAGR